MCSKDSRNNRRFSAFIETFASKMLVTLALRQREPARERPRASFVACKDGYTQRETTSALMLSAYTGLFTPSLIFLFSDYASQIQRSFCS